MKILFIHFNLGATAGINQGLAILSSVLKRDHHQVGLIFMSEELGYGFELEKLREDILGNRPELIGISLVETQRQYAEEFCKDLRKYYHGWVILGGPFPTMDPEDCLSMEGVNAVCVGEGEDALLELVEAIETGGDYHRIKNLWFKLPDGSILKNRLRPFKDLRQLPPEDSSLFDLNRILPLKNFQLEIILGRGCAYACTYCINHSYLKTYQRLCEKAIHPGDYIRTKDPDMVIAEIRETIGRYPQINKIAFIDDNFLMYKDLGLFLSKYLKEIGLPFVCNVNPLSFSGNQGKLLKEAGCESVRFGVESGSERIRREILRRPISNQKVAKAVRIAKELGLITSFYNMIGLPTESKEEVMETLQLNAALGPDVVKLMTFYPFKNTPIYEMCLRLDLINADKKRSLTNYDTFTCLNFSKEHQLFLEKIQMAFNWYLNLFLQNSASCHYAPLVEELEKVSREDWPRFNFFARDETVSRGLMAKGITHYRKFMNRSLAFKFPPHLSQADRREVDS